MKTSYKIATVWGIPIRVHISLLILMAYYGLTTWHRFQDFRFGLLAVGMGIIVFASIALHELGHSYVALRKNCPVRDITLMLLGGAARLERIPEKPRDEVIMALAGPAVSLALGIAFYLLAASPLASRVGLIALIGDAGSFFNFFIAGFNLIPSFPMDGGRVLRACLVKRHGRVKATYLASKLARVIACVFIYAGFFGISFIPYFEKPIPILILIGFFVFTASKREYQAVVQEEKMKTQGQHTWFSYGPTAVPPPAPPKAGPSDRVEIGPAPYDHGRGTKTDVHHGPK
jgi:Zn-dependent protease